MKADVMRAQRSESLLRRMVMIQAQLDVNDTDNGVLMVLPPGKSEKEDAIVCECHRSLCMRSIAAGNPVSDVWCCW